MATIIDLDQPATEPVARRRKGRLILGAVALAAVAGVAGWQAPNAVAALTRPTYQGENADRVAAQLECDGYTRASTHDESVYKYRDLGTCTINGTVVTITTFDTAADQRTFEAVMQSVIPIVHPTWSGASYAAGEGWTVADARSMTPEIAALAVQRMGEGGTHIVRSATS
ncbi:hypothetical protein [Dactylosporangium sp. CS-033363]|uniref:hypothetical protein n=1 Tax=Dactylosporangium sp. CS-033363 TaxID=3239935 RepID=UPI003D8AA495